MRSSLQMLNKDMPLNVVSRLFWLSSFFLASACSQTGQATTPPIGGEGSTTVKATAHQPSAMSHNATSLTVSTQQTAPGKETEEKNAAGFARYAAGLAAEATARGYSAALIDEVMSSLTFYPRVVQSDKKQPEFTETLDTYLPKRVSAQRIKLAKAAYRQYKADIDKVAADSGVPARFIVALWSLESALGRLTGNFDVPSALATLAYEGRREAFFRQEFFYAMDILAQQHITRDAMKGSWAGAMGQTQFMPSAFLKYAADGDGDQHKDIWRNKTDAWASIASYLKTEGWTKGQSWGRQVKLPNDFDYTLVIPKGSKDRAQWLQWWAKSERSIAQWRALGLTNADGSPLPPSQMKAALVMPDDQHGRAYLAYANYQVLMHWNRSYYFVTSVGTLADELKTLDTN